MNAFDYKLNSMLHKTTGSHTRTQRLKFSTLNTSLKKTFTSITPFTRHKGAPQYFGVCKKWKQSKSRKQNNPITGLDRP
jgi:hypothetical protein